MAEFGEQAKGIRKPKIPFLPVFAVVAAIGIAAYWGAGFYTDKPAPGDSEAVQTGPAAKASSVSVPSWDTVVRDNAFKRLFRVKRTTDLLGLHLFYLESRQVPQQIVIAENVPKHSSDIIFGETPDLALMTMISNQLLALRKKKNTRQLAVEKIETASATPLKLNGDYFQQRKVKVTIRFGNEKSPRHYLASMLKYAVPQKNLAPGKPPQSMETVIVTFAKPESFQDTLLATLLALNPCFSGKKARD